LVCPGGRDAQRADESSKVSLDGVGIGMIGGHALELEEFADTVDLVGSALMSAALRPPSVVWDRQRLYSTPSMTVVRAGALSSMSSTLGLPGLGSHPHVLIVVSPRADSHPDNGSIRAHSARAITPVPLESKKAR
jgi:hypothetical protein